jgi:hypothetical protein
MGIVATFVILDHLFQVRERFSGTQAYSRATGMPEDDRRVESALRFRIGVLLRPRDATGAVGGDPAARLIEAGLLYGRLALLQQQQGKTVASTWSMAQGVDLLRSGGDPNPTEAHIREVIARQDAQRDGR